MSGRIISFDGWVLDRESGDLTREGARQRLQELPLKVLDLLVANPGSVVTREQLIAHLWPTGVVDFDTGLNTAVRKLRLALGDTADTPRYIETLPRRGYRFLATLDQAAEPEPKPEPVPAPPSPAPLPPAQVAEELPSQGAVQPVPISPAAVSRGRRGISTVLAVVIAVAALLSYWFVHRAPVAAKPGAATRAAQPLAPLPDHTIAVLPFRNLSAAPDNEFLALGISEMVMHRLASTRRLMVIARTSSFVFKDRNEDARVIGRKLNARYLVEGSVQRAGERLRVTAELIDATSGGHVWSFNFDRRAVDLFALQDEISGKVADALSVSLSANARSAVGTSNLDAFLAYMQGLALLNTYRVADAEPAEEHFRRAAGIDPQFAAAYSQQAAAIAQTLWLKERADPVEMARATALNDEALSLDPSLGEAWVLRAQLHIASANRDDATIEREFRKGLALAPNYGQGFERFSNFLYDLHRTDEALVMIDRARQIDPLVARNHYLKGTYLWELGKDEQVAPLYLQALSINPNYHSALARLGQLRFSHGEFAEGMKLVERALAMDPQAGWLRESVVRGYLHLGDPAAAQDVLNDVKEGAPPGASICVLAYRGEVRAADASARAMLKQGLYDERPMTERCMAGAIRDEALATGRYDQALQILAAQYGTHAGDLGADAQVAFIWGLPYAQILQANGENARATQLTRAVLASIDRVIDDPLALPDALYWRAVALAMLGDSNAALTSLESAVHRGMIWGWYMIDREPAFASVKQNPRYQAVIAGLTATSRKQAALAAEMRKRHELPQRPRAG